MSRDSYGTFESINDDEGLKREGQRLEAEKIANALFEVKEAYGPVFANASNSKEFEDRWKLASNDVIKTATEFVVPTPRIIRQIKATLKTVRTASQRTAWTFSEKDNGFVTREACDGFSCPSCGNQNKLGFSVCACGKTWNSFTVKSTDRVAGGPLTICREVESRPTSVLAKRKKTAGAEEALDRLNDMNDDEGLPESTLTGNESKDSTGATWYEISDERGYTSWITEDRKDLMAPGEEIAGASSLDDIKTSKRKVAVSVGDQVTYTGDPMFGGQSATVVSDNGDGTFELELAPSAGSPGKGHAPAASLDQITATRKSSDWRSEQFGESDSGDEDEDFDAQRERELGQDWEDEASVPMRSAKSRLRKRAEIVQDDTFEKFVEMAQMDDPALDEAVAQYASENGVSVDQIEDLIAGALVGRVSKRKSAGFEVDFKTSDDAETETRYFDTEEEGRAWVDEQFDNSEEFSTSRQESSGPPSSYYSKHKSAHKKKAGEVGCDNCGSVDVEDGLCEDCEIDEYFEKKNSKKRKKAEVTMTDEELEAQDIEEERQFVAGWKLAEESKILPRRAVRAFVEGYRDFHAEQLKLASDYPDSIGKNFEAPVDNVPNGRDDLDGTMSDELNVHNEVRKDLADKIDADNAKNKDAEPFLKGEGIS